MANDYSANRDKIDIFSGEVLLESIKINPYKRGQSYSAWAGRMQGKLRKALAGHPGATHAHLDGHVFDAKGKRTGYIQKEE